MRRLYVTYGYQTKFGSGTGRNTYEISGDAADSVTLSMDEILQIEDAILMIVKEDDPTASKAYLTNWIWLRD